LPSGLTAIGVVSALLLARPAGTLAGLFGDSFPSESMSYCEMVPALWT